MDELIRAIVSVVDAVFAIWLTVQVVNRRKPWMCGIRGALTLIFGNAAIAPTFNVVSGTNGMCLMLFLFCVVGFMNSSRPAKRGNP